MEKLTKALMTDETGQAIVTKLTALSGQMHELAMATRGSAILFESESDISVLGDGGYLAVYVGSTNPLEVSEWTGDNSLVTGHLYYLIKSGATVTSKDLGEYGGTAVTSTTFNQHGVPADDFAVGEALAGKADADDLAAIEGDVESLADKVNAISTEIIQYPQLFDNILCIGDSLTVGYDGSGDTPLVKNYPHFIEKLTDANTTLKAHGGWTTKQIWDGEISTATDLANYDCAIIFLGTNGGLTDTVSTDCKADYTQNADTNTGCYGKIIGKIKADAPNCKIFCVAGVNDYIRRATTMNPAVRALAEFYSVGLIDVENCIMSDSGSASSAERYLYRPIDGIHYNALGYMALANMFYNAMSEFMSKHLTMYS